MTPPADDLETYVALAVALADPREDRARVLSAHGLDEERWEAIDEAWQARLGEAEADDPDAIPPFVAAFSEAFSRASIARAQKEISFERVLDAVREMRRGVDMATALDRLELGLDDFLRAQARWTAAMLEDDELAEHFRRAMH